MGQEPSKKLLEKQLRRQAEEDKRNAAKHESRRRNLVTFAVIGIVVALVVVAVINEREAATGPVGVAAAEAGCTEIEHPEEQGRDHIEDGSPHPPYSSSPPTSGPHYATPADAGFYESPIPAETAVHNLEHGQIVIWYDPGLDDSAKAQIEDITRDQIVATVTLPSSEVQAPHSIVLTAWGAMQSCEEISEEAVNEFRREFQGRGPENVGIPVFD